MCSNKVDIDFAKHGNEIECLIDDDGDDQLISQAYDQLISQAFVEDNETDTSVLTHNEDSASHLITLDDLLGRCSTSAKTLKELALDALGEADRKKNYDNDLNDSSTIATIILMDIFDEARKRAKQVKRWRKANPSLWKVNGAKKRRAEGSVYLIKNKIRPAKRPKAIDCSKCTFECSDKINEEARIFICRRFWSLDYVGQKNFLLANMEVKTTKTLLLERKRTTKRVYSTQCFFKIEDKINVCQKFFCKTLCISQIVIHNAIKNRDFMGHFKQDNDPRGRRAPTNKTPSEKVEEVRNHIRSFPSMESHYIRKDSKRMYLDCKLSIGKMYSIYVEECEKRNSKPVSEITYRRIFGNGFNLGFFKPKKDQCLICTKYANI